MSMPTYSLSTASFTKAFTCAVRKAVLLIILVTMSQRHTLAVVVGHHSPHVCPSFPGLGDEGRVLDGDARLLERQAPVGGVRRTPPRRRDFIDEARVLAERGLALVRCGVGHIRRHLRGWRSGGGYLTRGAARDDSRGHCEDTVMSIVARIVRRVVRLRGVFEAMRDASKQRGQVA